VAEPSKAEAVPKAPAAAKPMRKKYEICKNFVETGECKYGEKCLFAHGEHELYNPLKIA
jgi:hypothetical protein